MPHWVAVVGATAGPPPQAIQEAQKLLTKLGYAPGPADGVWGQSTVRAYRAFLRDQGRPDSTKLTPQALRVMRTLVERRGQSPESLQQEEAHMQRTFDTNGDGRTDQWEYYDADVLTRVEKDRDYDRRVDLWVTYQDGKVVKVEFDTNGSGIADQREFYGADGALQRMTSDQGRRRHL